MLRAWLDDLSVPERPDVNCSACPVRTRPRDPACCAFHPSIPNFLLGAALAAGGPGEQAVRARLARPSGVTPHGIEAGDWWQAGNDRCPYWREGTLNCSVWTHRGATCRTFFCKGSDASLQAWSDLALTLARAEHALARACLLAGTPPPHAAAPHLFEAWFRWCAEWASTADLPRPPLDGTFQPGDLTGHRRQAALPAVLAPTAPPFRIEGDQVHFEVNAAWGRSTFPMAVFALLSRFDGVRPWRDALRGLDLSEAVVDDLFRAGVVGPPPL